jgi:hypothetical protein
VLDRDVAAEVPAPIETVEDRLEDLYEQGGLELVRKDAGGRTVSPTPSTPNNSRAKARPRPTSRARRAATTIGDETPRWKAGK